MIIISTINSFPIFNHPVSNFDIFMSAGQSQPPFRLLACFQLSILHQQLLLLLFVLSHSQTSFSYTSVNFKMVDQFGMGGGGGGVVVFIIIIGFGTSYINCWVLSSNAHAQVVLVNQREEVGLVVHRS